MATAARIESGVKIYGEGMAEVRALDGVTLEIPTGAFTAIMGPSGSGKSTLMHCMAGLDSLTDGETWIGDRALGNLSDKELTRLRRDRIGFVFQAFNLIPTLTGEENITLPIRIAGEEPDQVWMDQVIDILAIRDRLSHRPTEMSGGQQQRIAAARALVSRPDIIFGDEPSGNLDTASAAELLGFLRRAVDEFDQTIVMVTHDPGAAAYADKVVFLRDGRIVDELDDPTSDSVIDRLRTLEA